MAAKKAAPKVDLTALGAHVVSVYGPFGSRVLIEMPVTAASDLFSQPLAASGRSNVVDAVDRDVEEIRKRSPELADSALAASAVALARELEHPYNSATSKAMCAGRLQDALRELRELAPPKQERDSIDELAAARRDRTARRAGTQTS